MLCGSDQGIYINMVEELQDNFIKGSNHHPANTLEACNLLVNYNTNHPKPETILVEFSKEVSFTNIEGSKGKSN